MTEILEIQPLWKKMQVRQLGMKMVSATDCCNYMLVHLISILDRCENGSSKPFSKLVTSTDPAKFYASVV